MSAKTSSLKHTNDGVSVVVFRINVSGVQTQAYMSAHTHTHTLQCVVFLGDFPNLASSPRPTKTRMVPNHCIELMMFPNSSTDPRMVKNFLVVVMREQVSGPKYTTVMKMKVCPRVLVMPNRRIL